MWKKIFVVLLAASLMSGSVFASDVETLSTKSSQLDIAMMSSSDTASVISNLSSFKQVAMNKKVDMNVENGYRSAGCSTGCSTGCSMGCSMGCSSGCSVGCRY